MEIVPATQENEHSFNVKFALNDFLVKELQKNYSISSVKLC